MQLITNSTRRSSSLIPRLIWPVVAFVVGLVVMGAIMRPHTDSSQSATEQAVPDTVTISALEGEVELQQQDGTWQAVRDGATVADGATVRIVGAGHAALNCKGLAVARIGADTSITLTEINDQTLHFTVDRGALYLRLPEDVSTATVTTPHAQYDVTGASAVVYAGDTDGVAVIVGGVRVTSAETDAQTITAGQSYYVATKDPLALRVVLPVSDVIVAADQFLQWNAGQDRSAGITNDQLGVLGAVPSTDTGSIQLTAAATDKGIVLTWRVEGPLDVTKGFKVVKSQSRNPEFPGSSYQSEPSASARTHTWDVADGQTYHFRICQYQTDGSCGVYSNDVAVTAPSS